MHDLSLQIVLLCFQCCIDLKHNVLRIGTTGNDAAFLSEADLKDKELLEKEQAVSNSISSRLFVNHIFSATTQALGMEDEDAEMAKAITKSEEEEEQRLQSELRREGERERGLLMCSDSFIK